MTEPLLIADEARVLGAMIEKRMTTPDHYPMSLNGVTTACNQVSNREPVTDFSESHVERTLRVLADRGLAKMVHRPGDRVVKYRQALDDELGTSMQETALLAVLLLRGPQTPGELRQRTQRYVEFTSLSELEAVLEGLRHRDSPLVVREERRPGQKEHRYRELLTNSVDEASPPPSAGGPVPAQEGPDDQVALLLDRLARLEEKVDRVYDELGLTDG